MHFRAVVEKLSNILRTSILYKEREGEKF